MRLRSSEPLARLTCKRAMIEIHGIPAQRFNRTQSRRSGRWVRRQDDQALGIAKFSDAVLNASFTEAVQRDCK